MKLLRNLSSHLNRELVWLLIFLIIIAPTAPALALPKDGEVVAGSGTITESPGKMQINQGSDKLILNWQSFGINKNESVKFVQPSSNSMALNRVLGSDASNIYGHLSANGRLFLINPNGVLFGPGSKVDVGGLVASTMNISDSDFLSNRFNFTRNGTKGSIINYGEITASPGGYIALLAPEVINEGVLTAKMGTIALLSGERITLDMAGDGLINFAVEPSAVKASIVNRHLIRADGGKVILSARSANDLISTVVNNTGIIEAKTITNKNGIIRLEGYTIENSGTLDVSGKITGEKGGTVQILGDNITLTDNTLIDASGDRGGGSILIGGNEQGKGPGPNAKTVSIDKDVKINADAITEGDGGKVIVWSDKETTFEGTISARGGLLEGDGGFTEVSGKDKLIYTGWTDLRAPHGETGTLLLDPDDYTIAAAGGDITGAALGTQLDGANVTIQTADAGTDAGDITVDDSVTWTSANTLTFRAHNDILVNNTITNNAGGDLIFRADSDANNGGTVTFGGLGHVTLTGGDVSLYYNPTAYNSPTNYAGNFTLNGGSILTPYMLVNDVNHLQAMNTNLSGTYALGRDIDASVTSTWDAGAGFVPVGGPWFTGIFDGLGHTINNLFINRPTTDYVGLFGYTMDSGIRNVGLENANITGRYNTGGLTGVTQRGTFTNVYITGTVSGNNWVGGLLAQNSGIITNAYSTATVSGSAESVGGLVGYNGGGGTITNSYSTGAVTGNTQVGGLVGSNRATITNSYSTGPVTGNFYVGGLVGFNQGTITNAYSTAAVTGNNTVGGLVGANNWGSITNSYWDTQTCGGPLLLGVGSGDGSGVTGKTTAEMMQQATFTAGGWDFANDWYMIEDNTRPFLRSEYSTTISNAHQLQLMSMNLGASYTLSRDIDMSELTRPSGLWNTGAGFVPVGTGPSRFTGLFEGDNHIISGLFINRPTTNFVGLFGDTDGATIRNVGLENVNMTGHTWVGGLVGLNDATITNAYSTGAVTGDRYIGGLVGYNNSGTITNAYSTGSVSGNANVGGFVGINAGPMNNSYWDTQTSLQPTGVGGGDGSGVTGKTTAEMMQQATFTAGGWNFANDWYMIEGNTRPFLRSEYSTTISNAHQLQLMSMNLGASYTLSRDIDMSELTYAPGLWNTSRGFVPVGTLASNFTGTFDGLDHTINNLFINRPTTDYVGFFGVSDGSTIRNIGLENVSITGHDYVGGFVGANLAATTNAYITGTIRGNDVVGGLVGDNAGPMSNAHSTATVSGINVVGGLVGRNFDEITLAYTTGAVTGSAAVGGLVGVNMNFGSITNAFSTGPVSAANEQAGGLVASNWGNITNAYSTGAVTCNGGWTGGLVGANSGTVTSSYWDTETSGLLTSAAGLGKTTAQMMQQATFAGWDFATIWAIKEEASYPYFRTQYGSSDPQVISGMLDVTGGGKTIQAALNGTLLAQTLTGANGFYYFTLPANTVSSGDVVLNYVSGNPTKASSVYLSAGDDMTDFSLFSNTVLAGSYSGPISNTELATAKGSLTSGDILYSVTGTNLNVNDGFGFRTALGTIYNLNGNVTTTNGFQTYNGPVSFLADRILTNIGASGNISFNDNVTGGGNNLTLNTSGTVTQTAPITLATLTLNGAGGTYNLEENNDLVTLAGNTGTVRFTDANGFTISGLTTSGNTILSTASTITQTGPINALGLSLLGTDGTYTLNNSSNAVTTLAGNTGSIDFLQPGSLTIGTVDGTGGIITSGTVTVVTTGGHSVITLDNPIASGAAGNSIVLAAGGNFVNHLDASALDPGPGRYLVYSSSPALNTLGGLTGLNLYNRTYAANPPATITQTGDRFVYSLYPTLTFRADDKTKVYGDPSLFTSTVTGYVGGDTAATAYVGDPFYTLSSENVGVRTITQGMGTLFSDPGYGFNFVDGTMTINKAPLTVTADDKSRVYGDPNPLLTATFSGFKNGETLATSGVLGDPSLSTLATQSSNVGPYAITAGEGTLTAGNYSFSLVDGTLTVNRAPLTVTADDKTRAYGDFNPPFTATYSGYKLGEDESELWGSMSFFTPATVSSSPGDYAITPSGLNSGNYQLSFVDGTLTIERDTQSLPIPQPDAPPNRPKIVDNTLGGGGGGFSGFTVIGAGVNLPPGVN